MIRAGFYCRAQDAGQLKIRISGARNVNVEFWLRIAASNGPSFYPFWTDFVAVAVQAAARAKTGAGQPPAFFVLGLRAGWSHVPIQLIEVHLHAFRMGDRTRYSFDGHVPSLDAACMCRTSNVLLQVNAASRAAKEAAERGESVLVMEVGREQLSIILAIPNKATINAPWQIGKCE